MNKNKIVCDIKGFPFGVKEKIIYALVKKLGNNIFISDNELKINDNQYGLIIRNDNNGLELTIHKNEDKK